MAENAKFIVRRAVLLTTLVVFPIASTADEALAKAKGCMACHSLNRNQIGPAYKEMSLKYAGHRDAESKLVENTLKGTPVPGGLGWKKDGKANLPFMPPTPGLKPDEATRLAKWILTQK